MNSLLFFTDITTDYSNLCLLNIKHYNDKRKEQKDLIFIDPSVYELKNSIEYSNIVFMHELVEKNQLQSNEFISIDYPCDMNLINQELFIQKSIENNIRYKENLQYICTIQCRFLDYNSFINNCENLRSIWEKEGKIIGLGNLCRILKLPKSKTNEIRIYCDKIFEYMYENFPSGKWLHFYGLSSQLIESYLPKMLEKFKVSVDSTKWTRARRNWFKLQNGACCRKHNRNQFFMHYIQELQIDNILF